MKAAMEDRTPRSSGETEEKKKKKRRSHEEQAKARTDRKKELNRSNTKPRYLIK